MSIRPGDIAMVINSPEHEGKIVKCVGRVAWNSEGIWGPMWEIEPPLPRKSGFVTRQLLERQLRVLRDPSIHVIDETLRRKDDSN